MGAEESYLNDVYSSLHKISPSVKQLNYVRFYISICVFILFNIQGGFPSSKILVYLYVQQRTEHHHFKNTGLQHRYKLQNAVHTPCLQGQSWHISSFLSDAFHCQWLMCNISSFCIPGQLKILITISSPMDWEYNFSYRKICQSIGQACLIIRVFYFLEVKIDNRYCTSCPH